jgi:ADP-heptose:LPS heptosyltransferase
MPTFKHSGAIGDVIYAMPAIRALGGGKVYMPTGQPSHFWHHIYGDPVPILKRLLESQPYVTEALPWVDEKVDYNLDEFRKFFSNQNFHEALTLCDMHLFALGLEVRERESAWITLDPKPLPDGKDVIICRTSRYRSPFFDWRKVREEYADRAVFCGMPGEYQEFLVQVGELPWLPTEDLLDLARYIAGCSLFIGNQSSPFAIAEGLKVNTLLEVCPDCPNCVFVRPGATYRTVY